MRVFRGLAKSFSPLSQRFAKPILVLPTQKPPCSFDGDERIFAKGVKMVKEIGEEVDGASGLVAVKSALAVIVKHCALGGSSTETIGGVGVQIAIGSDD